MEKLKEKTQITSQIYTYEEVEKSAIDYFKGDELAGQVWTKKYALKDADGNIYEKTPDEMHHRLAKEFARIEQNYPNPIKYDEIYELLKDFKYLIPQGSPMAGIGNDLQMISLSNCFVIGNDKDADSYGGILKLDQELVQLMKRRGGVGLDLSFVRPSNSKVNNSAMTSTGVVPFMERFSNSTREVAQGGRRGALMLSTHIKHPNSEEFIDAKMEQGKVTGANISVKISDDFMESVINNKDFKLQFPIDSPNPSYEKMSDAKKLWDKIIHNAHQSAEPGVLFWDTIIKESIADVYSKEGFNTVGTNPCLTGDSIISTNKGNIRIDEIVNRFGNGEEFKAHTYNETSKEVELKEVERSFLTKENANIIELELDNGKLLRLTPDHKIYTENRGWIMAAQLTEDDILIYKKMENIKKIRIKSIRTVKNEDVYDLTIKDNNNFFANGLLVHNCSEIPLCANDSCRLLAINLYSYVNKPFTDESSFDYTLFNKHVNIAQRLMDDLIDLELEKIEKIIEKINNDPEEISIKRNEIELWENIKEKCINGRRTGLGITAEGDMLAAMGLTYGTNDANNFSENIHMRLKHSAYSSSCIMAKERGAFPISDTKKELDHVWMQRIKNEDEELYNDLMKYGRRNIALLTIAPAGSLSILAQTSSGIEPTFLIAYMRRRKINPNDKGARIDFTDEMGDTWQEYPIFHHKFKDWYIIKSECEDNPNIALETLEKMKMEEIEKLIKISPWNKATSKDVDWEQKVKMQGMVQKHICHGISSTTNLPNDISEEMVSKVYMAGWEAGCKGLTVYRDGSRSGVLVSPSEKKEKETEQLFKDNNAPKRPKKIDAKIVRFNNNKEKWIAVVGILDDRPYEIFTGRLDGLPDIPNNIEIGQIIKIKSKNGISRYDFKYKDKDDYHVIIEGLSRSFNSEYWNYAKLISGILRHGMPLYHVVELISSLSFESESITTWKAGVARVIKKFIKDGTKSKNKCPECELDTVVYTEGCLICSNCGYSKCS